MSLSEPSVRPLQSEVGAGSIVLFFVVGASLSFSICVLRRWGENLITYRTAGWVFEFAIRSTSLGPADAGTSPVDGNLFADVPSITGDTDVSLSFV